MECYNVTLECSRNVLKHLNMFSMNTEKRLRFMHHLKAYLFIDVWFVKTIFENLRMHKNHNIEKITFKVGHIKYSAMHINN